MPHVSIGSMESLRSNPSGQESPVSTMDAGLANASFSMLLSHDLPQYSIPIIGAEKCQVMHTSFGEENTSLTKKRKATAEYIAYDFSPQSMSISNKRAAQGGNSPKGLSMPKLTTQNKRTPDAHSKSPSVSCKKLVQIESVVNKSQSVVSSNRNMQSEGSSGNQAVIFDSVRLKLRESLTAALALVSQQKDSSSDASNAVDMAAVLTPKGGIKTTGPRSSTTDSHKEESVAEGCDTSGICPADIGNDVETASPKVLLNGVSGDASEDWRFLGHDFQSDPVFPGEDAPFSDSFFFKDDLLQGHGLSWALDLDSQIAEMQAVESLQEEELAPEDADEQEEEQVDLSPESVASNIECELFELFGGVNKKYKEKGRSLLFNLKDRNNPELRERVMSGEISPERLCTMTAEELASKELSQWRMAKAEELAQMKVLPNSEVNVRRLVKKTHKGEYQVEFDQEVSVEDFSVNTSLVHQNYRKKTSVGDVGRHSEGDKTKEHNNAQCKVTLPGYGTDMLGLMVDDMRDLPPIVSLDEFMESLDKEPPFESLPVDSGKRTHMSDKGISGTGAEFKSLVLPLEDQAVSTSWKNDKEPPFESIRIDSGRRTPMSDMEFSQAGAESKSPVLPSEDQSVSSSWKNDKESPFRSPISDSERRTPMSDKEISGAGAESKSGVLPSADEAVSTSRINKEGDLESLRHDADVKSPESRRPSDTNMMAKQKKVEHIWEGLLQLTSSSTANVVAIYKSGEKASTRDWPSSFEIKGRVRLDAFDKFLQELPKSRTRAVMVAHFALAEKCNDEERSGVIELVDSYITDQRLGFAEPAPGLELYICPPRSKTVDMIVNHLPKSYTEKVQNIDNGLIGVLVWRKEGVTSAPLPSVSLQHKHVTGGQQFTSRRVPPEKDVNKHTGSTLRAVLPSPTIVKPLLSAGDGDGDDDDDVPPGFGPPGVGSDEDDLPEFNFSGGPNPINFPISKLNSPVMGSHLRPAAPSQQVEQMRELIQRYGGSSSNSANGISIQPWNDDDDDIPEWQPQAADQQQQPPRLPAYRSSKPVFIPHVVNRLSVQQPLVALGKPIPPVQPNMRRQGASWHSGPSTMLPTGSPSLRGQPMGTNYVAPVTGHQIRDWRPSKGFTRNRGF